MSTAAVTTAAVLAAIVIGGCGSANAHGHRSVADTAGASAPRTVAPDPATTMPGLARLRGVLNRELSLAGPGSSAAVYDLTAHAPLFALRDGVKLPPASIEKLYTSIALLHDLGPNARLHTAVLGDGHLGADGVWHGDLYLRGGGDPTYGDGTFSRLYEGGYGSTAAQLVQQLRGDGIRAVTGTVIGDESRFDSRRGGAATGYAPDIPDYGGQLSALTYDHGTALGRLTPAAFAAKQLVRTLRASGITATASRDRGVTPPGARELAIVSSPPLSVLLKLMNVPSDDLFAELLTKQLGAKTGDGTLAAGAAVIARTIAGSYDLHPIIRDGSGLLRSDRSSVREVLDLLRDVWHTRFGDLLSASLPIVGLTGTVRTIALATPAQGRCSAKTGTLNGVTNLAGYCTGRGRHMLAFALFDDGLPEQRALALEGRMIAAVASY
ncbi:MAG: D-alanyl-D-alanine carboxypeptidase/D-alanyl-D-alanine-endopeptidase [Solirubrobacteraceae bacterium]